MPIFLSFFHFQETELDRAGRGFQVQKRKRERIAVYRAESYQIPERPQSFGVSQRGKHFQELRFEGSAQKTSWLCETRGKNRSFSRGSHCFSCFACRLEGFARWKS